MANKRVDSENFEEIFNLYFKDLMHVVYGYIRDKEVAKDIVHDVFLALWNNRERLDATTPLKAYLVTLSRNYAFNYLKHRRVLDAKQEEIAALWENAAGELDEYEARLARLEEKLKELSDKQREVIAGCFMEGKTYKQVADELHITVNTVKTHLTRGLNFLRDELREEPLLLLLSCRS